VNKTEFEEIWKDYKKEYYLREDVISWRWVTGGMSGGSCWGDKPSYMGSEEEPEETPLDEFLQKYFPLMPYFAYKKLLTLVDSKEDYEPEYYGNYTNYRVKSISKDVLLNYLIDIGLVTD
jgi:hypothetical protein